MAMSGIKVTQSRFASLMVDSDEEKKKKKQQNDKNQEKPAQKKKDKKKRQQHEETKQEPLVKRRRLLYDRDNLQLAYEATLGGMSAYRAAKIYSVPSSTLRDRINGRVASDARVGHETIFTPSEEEKLYNHVTNMAEIGFGYNKTSIQYMAKDYADFLSKQTKGEKLSDNWFYGFVKRWPDLKIVRREELSTPRTKSASSETVDNYYKEFEVVPPSKNIKNKPWKIFHLDETGLQQLAFCPSGKKNRPSSSKQQQLHLHTNGASGEPTASQWKEWKKLDEEFTQDTFEKDLEQALLLSRLENEEEKQRRKREKSLSDCQTETEVKAESQTKDSKKKKKKPMSLEEFNKKTEEKKTHADVLDDLEPAKPQSPTTKVPVSEYEEKFFESIEKDAHKIVRRDKIQEEYQIQYAAESVITAKYQEKIKKLDKEVDFLKATMKKQEDELKQVKKRNKQLCVILAQGEMKDKSEVLLQVDQLNEVKDELTSQVSELTAELEKERSKVHALRAELDKLKANKHK